MEITVNKTILQNIYDDKSFYSEIYNLLNSIIDEELEKEEPDCDLIDECISALDDIQKSQNPASALHLVLTKKAVLSYCKKHSKNGIVRKTVAAAALLVVLGSSIAFAASPELVKSAQSFFDSISSFLFEGAKETENNDNEISSIYVTFPEKTEFKIKNENEINLENVVITAVFSNSKTKEIPLSDCKITKTAESDGDNKYIIVAISYHGCACSVVYEVEG